MIRKLAVRQAKFILRTPVSQTLSSCATTAGEASPKIGYWLLGMGGLVGGMVTVGGITRLTKSGLSMTDWKVQGSLPPLNEEEWSKEFERYKQFPEWNQRKSMNLEEFKSIYFWEYGHRMFGRFLGIAFVAPLAYFGARGMIPRSLYPRLVGLLGLGGAQGLIGWWMVKSGLEVDPNQLKEIRVSPYRLATHLAMAFTTLSLLVWTGMDVLNPMSKASKELAGKTGQAIKFALKTRKSALRLAGFVFLTAMSGAFVAGNDAGRAYNTFPMMDDEWIPLEIADMDPPWRNFFENTATVQFDHRVLALSTYAGICWTYVRTQSSAALWETLPLATRLSFHTMFVAAAAQVGLGVFTLLTYVPVPLAAAHQTGSMVLLTSILVAAQSLRYAKLSDAARIIRAAAAATTTATTAAAKGSAKRARVMPISFKSKAVPK